MLTIVADEKIPLISELFDPLGKVILLPGTEITSSILKNANILLTRTITAVNENLLKGTNVSFVGSATAGYDHLDTAWLKKAGIAWGYAPGANAVAVAEYVVCCVAWLQKEELLPKKGGRAGIIGVGQAGTCVSNRLQKVGYSVLENDPPRAQQEVSFISTPLENFYDLDLICIHSALTTDGPFSSFHLINDDFLKKLKSGCVILNAARGAIIDNAALLNQPHLISCLDVWENEPQISLPLLKQATLATPHVAGYSEQAKLKATFLIYEKVLSHFNITPSIEPKPIKEKTIIDNTGLITWEDTVLKIYNPHDETQIMKKTLSSSIDPILAFEKLRREYVFRPEFSSLKLKFENKNPILQKLNLLS